MSTSSKLRLAHASIKSDPAKAAALFKDAAATGNLSAMLMADSLSKVASAYKAEYARQGGQAVYSAVKKNEKIYGQSSEIISRQYRIAAESGSGKAALRIASDQEAQGASDAEVAKWYEKAAKNGEPKAMMMLARQAKIGRSAKGDQQAFEWYKKAAEAGHAEGQYETGLAYSRGQGTSKDLEKARYWLKKAQTGGYVLALDVLKTIDKE
jgi:TPR repeat protein